jgi:hypothetical protein
MSDPSTPYRNAFGHLQQRLREYASQDYADRIARGEFPEYVNCEELALGFDDVAFAFDAEGAKYLSLSPVIVEKLVAFRKAINDVTEDGSDPGEHRRHFFALYAALRDGAAPPVPPPNGPRWRSDRDIVMSDDWKSIQEQARDLLALIANRKKQGLPGD